MSRCRYLQTGSPSLVLSRASASNLVRATGVLLSVHASPPMRSHQAGRPSGVTRALRLGTSFMLASLAACGDNRSAPPIVSPQTTTSPGSESAGRPSAEACNASVPFEPGFLPKGFQRRQFRGPAPGAEPADSKGQVIVHYRGPGGKAIEIRGPGTMFSELALSDEAPTVEVLGEDTPNFGPVEPGGTDFIVQFIYAPGAERRPEKCTSYSLNGYGLTLGTLKRVAESLRPT